MSICNSGLADRPSKIIACHDKRVTSGEGPRETNCRNSNQSEPSLPKCQLRCLAADVCSFSTFSSRPPRYVPWRLCRKLHKNVYVEGDCQGSTRQIRIDRRERVLATVGHFLFGQPLSPSTALHLGQTHKRRLGTSS